MFSESSGMPGRSRHRPRTARSICTPGARGPVERVDHGGVGQAVELEHDATRRAGLGLLLDHGQDALAHRHRRHEDLAVVGVPGEAGEVVEELAHVGADLGVRRQQPDVLVDARRLGVVVPRAHVAVVAYAVLLAAQHQRRLGVRLEPDDAVDHVHAHLFERAGPADVRLLVEARLELDDGGHLLAVLGGPDERRPRSGCRRRCGRASA